MAEAYVLLLKELQCAQASVILIYRLYCIAGINFSIPIMVDDLDNIAVSKMDAKLIAQQSPKPVHCNAAKHQQKMRFTFSVLSVILFMLLLYFDYKTIIAKSMIFGNCISSVDGVI